MFKRKFILILALFMVLLSVCAVSASEDVSDNVTAVSDDISMDEVVYADDSVDESNAVQNDEQAGGVDDSNSALAAQNENEKEITGQSLWLEDSIELNGGFDASSAIVGGIAVNDNVAYIGTLEGKFYSILF